MTERARLFPTPLAAARTLLFGIVNGHKRGDPLAPVTVLGPSTYANLSLRHELGRRGFANVRFLVLPRLAELLGAPSLAARQRRPLTPLLESAAVRAAAAQASGALAAARDHASLHRSLHASFRDLRSASPAALARLAAGGPVQAETVRLYRLFIEATQEYYSREDLFAAAADAVAAGRVGVLDDPGALVFLLTSDLSPGERALVASLSRHDSDVSVILALTGDEDADRPLRALASDLEGTGFAVREETAPASSAEEAPEGRLLIAPDAHEEVRQTVRRLLRAATDGVAFPRMAVLYRHAEPYASLLREQLAFAGVRPAGPGGMTAAETAAGRTLLGLLRLAEDGGLARDDVMSWLTGCPVLLRPTAGRGEGVSPSRWDAVSRRAGIVRGANQWRTRLDQYARALEQRAAGADAGGDDDLSEAAIAYLQREASAARALASFIAGLARALRPPADGSPWRAFVGWARDLMNAYHDGAAQPDLERAALERIHDTLREMEDALDALQPGGSALAQFATAVREALDVAVGHLGRTGEGVFVGPLAAVTGMSFDVVHVVGMVEGMVPPRGAEDPLLPDDERRRAGGPEAGLPLRGTRLANERYAYLAALASAPRRVLSFPRADLAAQRALHPSRWFLEEASRLHGSRVHSSTLARLGDQPWLAVVASQEDALRAARAEAPADAHDYDLEGLWRWRRARRPLADHHLAQSARALGQGWELLRDRRDAGLTAWSGDVSGLTAASPAPALFSTRALSPTGLETWAACPFRYFLGRVLRVAAPESPEETLTITPLERGALVHRLLERFLQEVRDRGDMPAPGVAWSADHRSLLRETAAAAFRDAQERGVTGKALLWDLERASLLSDLDEFLEQDADLRASLNVAPYAVEMRFEGADASWDLGDGVLIALRGAIDRVDLSADGRLALVLDYKTGSAVSYKRMAKDAVDRGRRLQLPVYANAVRRRLGDGVAVRAAYWFVTARGGFERIPPSLLDPDQATESFRRAVDVIAGGIRQGLFPANPGPPGADGGYEHCRICEFDAVCSTRRDLAWRRQQRDPRLAPYAVLTAASEEDPTE